MNSYCIGTPGQRFYGGCAEIDTIELKTRQVVCELFGAKYCEVQLLSGMMANIAAYNAMLPRTGCTVMASPSKHGGHYSHNAGGPLTRLFGANVVQTPWDPATYNVNIDELALAMETHKPTLLVLGWSEMLFEHDLPAIRKICDEYDCKLMYDMSHVAGLIAGGQFQKDMMQYADIVASSTGKSLHSADHGLVLYNDPALTPKIREAVMPLLTSNTHFHETASLCMTLLEMKEFGASYAKQVVANTQALARAMIQRNFKLLCPKLGYSKTH
jgi:glycine hydroxymethyltransferase